MSEAEMEMWEAIVVQDLSRPECDCCGARDGRPLSWSYACEPHVVWERLCEACADETRRDLQDPEFGAPFAGNVRADGSFGSRDEGWYLLRREAVAS